MERAAGRRDGRVRRAAVPYLVLVAALGLAMVGTTYVATTVHTRERLRFNAAVRRLEGRLDARLATYTAMMRATDGLYAARWPVWPEEFRAYAARLDLRKNYPGVFGIGVALRSPGGGREAFETYIHNAIGFKDFKVWPAVAEGEWTAIIYLEPQDERNGKALGYDMYTDPVRREAMERARDDGVAAASGRVALVQDQDDANATTGFVIYMPVYADRVPPTTVEERRKKTRGYVFCPFRSKDLFGDVFADEAGSGLGVRIYDGKQRDEAQVLYQTADADHAQAVMESTSAVIVAGRPWTVVMAAGPGYREMLDRLLPAGTALAGIAVSAALFLLVRSQLRGLMRAEQFAAESRESQHALRAAKDSAEEANRLKDEFLATVSHELRTPLNAILGWAQLLSAEEGASAEDVNQGIETILRNARVQAQLVADLLDVSRIVSGKLRLEARPVDLAAVVRAAIGSVGLAAEAKGVRVVEEIGDAVVSGDADRLQQVVWNLLSNSIKFTERDGTIVVRSWQDAAYAQVEVRDTGAGIDAAFLPYVFDRFRQADGSLTRKHGGLGLGLSIARNLVELHGGTVRAQSEGSGRGATFTVTLPVRKAASAAHGSSADHAPAKSVALEGIRVLVVDDDPDTRELVRHILAAQHATVLTAGTVRRALDLLRTERVQVLVSDLAMPAEDGYDLIRILRELPAQYGGRVPAVALSALVRPADRERALAAGFQAHVPKPVEAGELVGVVGELGRGSGSLNHS